MTHTVPDAIAEQHALTALRWLDGQSYKLQDGGSAGLHELTVWREGHPYTTSKPGTMPTVIVPLVDGVRRLIEQRETTR